MLKRISADIIKSIERSNKQVSKIPTLNHSKITERILESFIDGIKRNKRIDTAF
jgi:hypothetical protein